MTRTQPPTVADVHADPEYWIAGPGRDIARRTDCGHGYKLTDSCPNCDADLEGPHCRVVGIDPSLTATGLAAITGEDVDVRTITTKPAPRATFTDRDQRIQHITDEVIRYVNQRADLVVIEGPSLGSTSPHTWDRAGLWWRIVHRLNTAEIPLAVCPPTVRAKWATGKGNAGKAAVVAAIARVWPDVPLDDDNTADALTLATIGAQRIAIPTPARLLARHRDALDTVAWPDLIPAE